MNDGLIQNLKDAGCSDDFIKNFTDHICDKKECEKLLSSHRRKLLDEIHKKEENISCLDYLIFMMKKEDLGGI